MIKKINNYSPLRYPGGKNKIYNYVKHLVSENGSRTYIEPYCGGAAVALKLLINQDVDRIILNDFDRSIYALWYSILHQPEELISLVQNASFSFDEWEYQRSIQKNKLETDLLSLGFSTLYLNRTNRSGIINAGVIGGKNQNGSYTMDCRFNKPSLINKIKIINSKKSKIRLYNKDALVFIKENISKTKKAFIFFDPPYFLKGKKLYTNFYEPIDHIELEKSIQKYLSEKKWIVTYDVTPEIKNIYDKYEHYEYYLNYSVSDYRKGKEYIFFSNHTSSSKIESFLSLH
ncbi:DNA adenine methylase [Exiguobacterium sp. N5]|uniref:DNA adenine methylase n=1 Tax=Exiguobacterium sp. N5 TaxID=2990450 RepID=UPI0021F48640|nr:DNA adenine methylase [Exiguobacterium sp. N5]MCV9898649.1 DNA adenine methylase [Exiguobacterium sp. N5]